MYERSQIPPARLEPGARHAGFEIGRVCELEEIRARLYEARHLATGAAVLHVHCNDPENLFSVGFLTPPEDSRGTPHILEHAVLAGSERFPVKDAFYELERRSLATFLNAFTWPDRTIYPVASAVPKDYFNLAEVYGDLVFHPRLTEQTFWQEGVHLEPRTLEGGKRSVVWAGVVYNEMRGAYSAPEQWIDREIRRRLQPDTIYRHDAGGDPECIPELTHEELIAFHRRYYTADNARFFLYGDTPPERNLEFLARMLEGAPRGPAAAPPQVQPRWRTPRSVSLSYPIAPGAETERRSFCVLAWLGPKATDVEAVLALDVVLEALLGSAAGALRRALIDAGLGADLFPAHAFDTEGHETLIEIGLRGTEPEYAERIEETILETLGRVVERGLERDLVEAALHQIELAGREISPPFPVVLLTRVSRLWYYGGDPVDGLRFGEQIARLRRRLETEPRYLEGLIRRHLLENPHRLRVVARPDPELSARREKRLAQRLEAIGKTLSEAELDELERRARELRQRAESPDDPEAIESLPRLEREEIPRAVRTIPTETAPERGARVLRHPVFTNGMVYLGLAFDLRGLDEEEVAWLPLLGTLTTGMGAAGLDYEHMARRLLAYTGGVGSELFAARRLEEGAGASEWLIFDGKALVQNAEELFAIMGDLTSAPDPSDLKRLADLVRESATRAEGALIPRAHRLALLAAAQSLGRVHRLRERCSGVSQLLHLRALADAIEQEAEAVRDRIAALQRRLFTRSRLVLSVAAEPQELERLHPLVAALIERLPASEAPGREGADESEHRSEAQQAAQPVGIACATDVSFVAEVWPTVTVLDRAAAAIDLLAHALSTDYLYKRVRVQGGAYGGWCSYALEDGVFHMASYRDPQLERTVRTYEGVLDWAKRQLDEQALEGARLGAIAARERILSPEEMLRVARRRHLIGLGDDVRQAFKDQLLTLELDAVRERALERLERARRERRLAAVSARERLEEAARALGIRWRLIDAS